MSDYLNMDLAWEHGRDKVSAADVLYRVQFMSAPCGKKKAVPMVEYFTDAEQLQNRVNRILEKEAENDGYKLLSVNEYRKLVAARGEG